MDAALMQFEPHHKCRCQFCLSICFNQDDIDQEDVMFGDKYDILITIWGNERYEQQKK